MSDFHAGKISRENIYLKLKLVERLIAHCTCCSRVLRSWKAVLFLRERGAREEADTRELWLESASRLSDLLSSSSSSSNSSDSSTSSWGQQHGCYCCTQTLRGRHRHSVKTNRPIDFPHRQKCFGGLFRKILSPSGF